MIEFMLTAVSMNSIIENLSAALGRQWMRLREEYDREAYIRCETARLVAEERIADAQREATAAETETDNLVLRIDRPINP